MSPRILVVDDDASICKIYKIMLTRLGYDATTVNTGEEGVRVYTDALKSATPFRVVILDLTLGEGMNGLETLGRLRELDPAVCALASSGSSSHTVGDAYLEHGFKGAVLKPFRFQDVARCLDNLIGKPPA